MNVLGYPKVKGNSQEIAVYDTVDGNKINAGCVVSQNAEGKAVAYDSPLAMLGVAGKVTLSGAVDVLRRGIEVAMLLAEGQSPNGGACFIDETGAVASSGDLKIGVFASSESFNFYDPNTNSEKKGCFVNLDINNIPTASSSEPPEALSLDNTPEGSREQEEGDNKNNSKRGR
jgi:hypothetical protein